jgi:hypothetical protein
MRVTVDLPVALLRELNAKAAIKGTTLKQLILTLVERGLHSTSPAAQGSKRSPLPALNLKRSLAIRSFSNARLFELLDD